MSVLRASLLAFLLVGCTTNGDDPTAPPSAEPPSEDAPVVAHEAPLKREQAAARSIHDEHICTFLPLTSSDVAITRVASELQPATGGDIVPGTYDLTADIIYTGAGGDEGTTAQAFAQTIRLSDDRLEATSVEKGVGSNGSGRFVTSGTMLGTMEHCPEPGHLQAFHYTATSKHLEVHIGGGEVLVYTLR